MGDKGGPRPTETCARPSSFEDKRRPQGHERTTLDHGRDSRATGMTPQAGNAAGGVIQLCHGAPTEGKFAVSPCWGPILGACRGRVVTDGQTVRLYRQYLKPVSAE